MDRYRVKPGKCVDLSDWDPDGKETFDGKKAAGQGRHDPARVPGG